MRWSVLVDVWCVCLAMMLVSGFTERLPIGAIFDHASKDTRSAFSFEIMNRNSESGQSMVKLESNSQKIQVNDSYMLSTTICSQMANGIFALFGTHSIVTLPTLRSFTSTFHMPFVTPSMAVNVSGQELGYELYMRPLYGRALIDVIKHYNWLKVYYIYESEEGLARLQQLFDFIGEDGLLLEVKVHLVRDAMEAYNTLAHLDASSDEDKHILLDLPTSECEELLKLQKTDANRVKLHYLLVGLGISELRLDAYRHGGINMTGFQLVDFHNTTVKRFFEMWSSMDNTWEGGTEPKISVSARSAYRKRKIQMKYEAALAVDSVRLIAKALSQMVARDSRIFSSTLRHGKFFNNGTEGIDCDSEPVVPWRHGYDIMKTMREIEFHGISGKVAFDSFGLRRDYKLDILEVNLNRGLAKIGTWTTTQGLSIQSPSLVRSKGNNTIANKTRIVTSILTEPYLIVKPDTSNGQPLVVNERYEGYCADLATKIADIVGYTYVIKPVKDGKYGSKDENGTWNGMVGELVRNTEPYLMWRNHSDGGFPLVGNDRFEGYCVDLARMMGNIIGYSYIMKPVADGIYGSMVENGTWNGMIGELLREEADLAIAPLTITSVRERVIDFSKPFMSLGISIMIKKPTKEIPGVFSFMYPLSYEIWMCVIFAYIGVSVVLFLVSRFSPFEWHIEDNSDGPTVTNNFTIFNSLWFSLGAFMQQGCDIEPRSMSGRIVGSVWWFFTLIIISSYTANLAAFLTVERMQSPIESADDLAKQTEIKYGTVESGSTMEFFRMSTIPVYERMWAFMSSAEPSVFVGSNEDGVKQVRGSNGRYAFLTESTTNDYINQRKPCDTMKVGSNLDSKGYGIGTPLGSDLRDRITLAVLELRENGELQKLEKKWWYDKGECGKDTSGKKKDATSALKLTNVAGIFYILVGGLVLALLMAVMEFLYKSKVEARRRKTSFSNAVKSKARLSIKGKPDTRQSTAVGSPDLPANMSMSTYTYAPAAQLISLDGYADGNTHTQV